MPINWGPVRHGPGHNVAIYHRNFDDQNVEFYIELDQMKDEELGLFRSPPVASRYAAAAEDLGPEGFPNLWGPLPTPDFLR